MHEYPLRSNGKIWNVKWQHCGPNSLNTMLYEISVQKWTGLDLGLEPFFNTAQRDCYKSFWLPTEIDFRDSHSAYSSSSLLKQGNNSWFMVREGFPRMTNSERICSASFTNFCADNTVAENTERNGEPPKTTEKSRESCYKRPCHSGGKDLDCPHEGAKWDSKL